MNAKQGMHEYLLLLPRNLRDMLNMVRNRIHRRVPGRRDEEGRKVDLQHR